VVESTTASVVRTTSIVARPGASMPAPFAIPPTDQPLRSTCVVLGRVSVVMMASAATGPPSRLSAFTAASTPARSLSIGSRSPIRPVEHTATSAGPTMRRPRLNRAAVNSAVAWVSWNPCGPVHALAPPELSTTARTMPALSTCWLHSTGAALTRFAVNTPAAVASGPSLTTSATSSPPDAFSPAATPLARNPFGPVTLMGSHPRDRRGQAPSASPAGRA
jgi:hypothetical protein